MMGQKTILDQEHEELVEQIDKISHEDTEVGRIYAEVLRIFRLHLERENDTIVPLVKHLKERIDGFGEERTNSLREAKKKFEESYGTMMREHEELSKLIRLAENSIKTGMDPLAADLSEKLLHHVELEEEILYPAAFASGDLLEFEKEIASRELRR